MSKPALGISILVMSAPHDRVTAALTAQLRPNDELLFIPTAAPSLLDPTIAEAGAKCVNRHILLVHANECLQPSLEALRTELTQNPDGHRSVSVLLPHVASDLAIRRPELRVIDAEDLDEEIRFASCIRFATDPVMRHDASHALRHRLMLSLETVEAYPHSATAWLDSAGLYLALRQWSNAEASARHALLRASEEQSLDASQIIAHAMFRMLRYRQLNEHLRTARLTDQESAPALYYGARAHLVQNHITLAHDLLDYSLKLPWDGRYTSPDHAAEVARQLLRAEIHVHTLRDQEALEALNDLPDTALLQSSAALSITQILKRVGKPLEALHTLRPALSDRDYAPVANRLAGELQFELGNYLESDHHYEVAWDAGEQNPDLFVAWIKTCEGLADPERIQSVYEKYSVIGHTSVPMLVQWGREFDERGETDNARNCFAEALRRAPDQPDLYFSLGDLLMRSGQVGDAAFLFESGLKLRNDETAQVSHRQCLQELGLGHRSDDRAA
ncbi:MAG: tetratricopeptide repeat protein [Chthonomonas sp.]|nr:tetratricopeptide repeat protein [Chthonomonas sp.]